MYKVYVPIQPKGRPLGACWQDETVEEALSLCDDQTITPSILKHLSPKGKILDAGCGLGRWVSYFKRRGFTIYGMDIAQEGLKQAKSYDPSLNLFAGDSLILPLKGKSVDTILSLGVIEHFEGGPHQALREMYRVLKPEGTLCVAVPYQSWMRSIFHYPYQALVLCVKKTMGRSFEFGEFRYNRREMENFLKSAGFKILTVEPDDFRFPRSLGFFTDWYRYVRHKTDKWELNAFGRLLAKCLNKLSPWCYPSGIFFVAARLDEP